MQNGSITDLTFNLGTDVTVESVNEVLKNAADQVILGYETKPLVSVDYVNDTRSGIVDAMSTIVVGKRMAKVMVWYDNEVITLLYLVYLLRWSW